MPTVEAIQVELIDKGFILWPSTTPPAMITDEALHSADKDIRFFKKANSRGPIYRYKYHVQSHAWFFREKIDGRTDNI